MTTDANATITQKQIDELYKVFGGHILFQTLRTAVKLGLFDLLAQQKSGFTRKEIATRLSLHEQPLRIILLGLVSTNLVLKEGGFYINSAVAEKYLVKTSPNRIVAYVELQHHVMYKGLYWLLDSVREYKNVGLKEIHGDEKTLYQRIARDPELEKIFQDAMQELSLQANPAMRENENFGTLKHVVDVGGGDGTNVIALAKRWPHLKATVFDSPTVCEIAKANFAAHGLSDRLNAVPGNCFTDPFPSADALLFSHFFTIWSEAQDRQLFKKCFDSLPSHGKVMIFNMMQNDDESGPLSAALGSPYFLALATGQGMLYTWREYETWMKDAGFKDVQRQTLPIDHGLIIGTK